MKRQLLQLAKYTTEANIQMSFHGRQLQHVYECCIANISEILTVTIDRTAFICRYHHPETGSVFGL